jgi:hypothetical protein
VPKHALRGGEVSKSKADHRKRSCMLVEAKRVRARKCGRTRAREKKGEYWRIV